ncbi:MAG: undecaprenyl diphosphate synthase family protein [Thermodesulfobacteriota bacterium]
MNYTTIDDLLRAIKKTKTRNLSSILSEMDEPDNIDIILRTGGNRRLSGFTPLKSPSAEFVVVPEYFPDLTPERIRETIAIYRQLEVRNGL